MRNSGLQLTAGLCSLLAVYPIWYWFTAWIGAELWLALALTGGSLLLGTGAWLHRRFGYPLEQRSLLLAGMLARAVALALGAGAWALARPALSTTGSIVAGVLVLAVYLAAWEIYRLPAESLLSVYAFILMCVCYFVSILFCLLQGTRQFSPFLFVMLCGSAALFTILHSYQRLYAMAEGRETPQGFFGFHGLLLGGFLLLGGGAALGGGHVIRLLIRIALALGKYLTQLIRFVTALLFRDHLLIPEDSGSGETEPLIVLAPWLGPVINLLTVVLVGALLWRFRHEFLDFLQQILQSAMRAVRQLAALRAPAPLTEEHMEYSDSVELLEISPLRRIRRHDPLREARRRWRKTADPREKYRAGYAVWLLELKERGVELRPNCPPARIHELAGGLPDPALTAHMTEVYYRVRYGTHVPDPAELREMEQILRACQRK